MFRTIQEIISGLTIIVIELFCNVFYARNRCLTTARLDGKVVLITGANAGIGKETALQLTRRGAKVYIGCRNLDKANAAVADIRSANPSADITALELDVSSLKSVRHFVEQFKVKEPVIDILINNAGVVAPPKTLSEDGFEMTIATNHLGPFLLTMLLLPQLKRASHARIVNVSSGMYTLGQMRADLFKRPRTTNYDRVLAYYDSKLANVLFTRELARRLGHGNSIKCYALHPGAVRTQMAQGPSWFLKLLISPELGCQTTLHCALDEELGEETGCYYDNCRRVDNLSKDAMSVELARRLWQASSYHVDLMADRQTIYDINKCIHI